MRCAPCEPARRSRPAPPRQQGPRSPAQSRPGSAAPRAVRPLRRLSKAHENGWGWTHRLVALFGLVHLSGLIVQVGDAGEEVVGTGQSRHQVVGALNQRPAIGGKARVSRHASTGGRRLSAPEYYTRIEQAAAPRPWRRVYRERQKQEVCARARSGPSSAQQRSSRRARAFGALTLRPPRPSQTPPAAAVLQAQSAVRRAISVPREAPGAKP